MNGLRTVCAVFALTVLSVSSFTIQNVSAQEDPYSVTIPIELYANGKRVGEIIVRATPTLDDVSLQGSALKERLQTIVAESMQPLIASLPDDFTPLAEIKAMGLEISLNLEKLIIEVLVQGKQDTSTPKRTSIRLSRLRAESIHGETEKEARVSGKTNFRLRSSQSDFEGNESMNHVLQMEHTLNIRGWATLADSILTVGENSEEVEFSIDHFTLERYMNDRAWSVALGDIQTTVTRFQRGGRLFGISVVKDFDLKPYDVFTPTSGTDFDLEEASTVEVKVNGSKTKTLRLKPGSYNIEDFRLLAGENSLDLEILGESGSSQTLNLTEYGSPIQLGQGVDRYALSLGLPAVYDNSQRTLDVSLGDVYERRLAIEPSLSAFYMRGLTDSLTGEIALQAQSDWRRLGANAHWSNAWGNFSGSLAANQVSSAFDLAAGISWNNRIGPFNAQASLSYFDQGFERTRVRDGFFEDALKLNGNFNLSTMIGEKTSFSLGGYFQDRYGDKDKRAASLRLGRRIAQANVSLQLRWENDPSRIQSDSIGGYMTFTWSPSPKWRLQSRAGAGGLTPSSNRLSVSYANRRINDAINARLNFTEDDEGRAIDGFVGYFNNNYALRLSRSQTYEDVASQSSSGEITTFEAELGIAFADGAFGIARSIGDSFALVSKHAGWEDVSLGINPSLGGYERKMKNGFFKPVITNLRPYQNNQAVIQTTEGDLIMEKSDFHFFPSKNRGTKVVVGTAAIYAVRSALFYEDGEPVAHKAISMIHESGEKIVTFTNGVGRFVAMSLLEGEWTIRPSGSAETATMAVEGEEKFQFVDMIVLKDKRQ